MNNAVNRFDVQVVFDDRACLRIQSKKGGVTRAELLSELEGFLEMCRDYEARKALGSPAHD